MICSYNSTASDENTVLQICSSPWTENVVRWHSSRRSATWCSTCATRSRCSKTRRASDHPPPKQTTHMEVTTLDKLQLLYVLHLRVYWQPVVANWYKAHYLPKRREKEMCLWNEFYLVFQLMIDVIKKSYWLFIYDSLLRTFVGSCPFVILGIITKPTIPSCINSAAFTCSSVHVVRAL